MKQGEKKHVDGYGVTGGYDDRHRTANNGSGTTTTNVVVVQTNKKHSTDSFRKRSGSGSLRSRMAEMGTNNEWQPVLSHYHSRTGCHRVYGAIQSVYDEHQKTIALEQQAAKAMAQQEEQLKQMVKANKEKQEEEDRRKAMSPQGREREDDPLFNLPPSQLCSMADRLLVGNNNSSSSSIDYGATIDPTVAINLDRANALYQQAICTTHHTSTTYAIHQQPLPNTNGPPSALLPSTFDCELPLPEYIDRQQCEYITRWARGILLHLKSRLRSAHPHFDIDTPSIRQALHCMEEQIAIDEAKDGKVESNFKSHPL
jgi:hypothetical protein